MYKLHLYLFGYFHHQEFETFEEALEKAKQIQYECAVYKDNVMVGSWSPLGGFSHYQ